MKNNFQPKTQMTNEEICQKYNNGRRIIDFVGHKRYFWHFFGNYRNWYYMQHNLWRGA